MVNEVIFIVKPEQIGSEDVGTALRRAIDIQFKGKEYYIAKEELVKRSTYYSKTPRKLRGYMINENGVGHAIWFDVTDLKSIEWA
jgi:hypothetical protein